MTWKMRHTEDGDRFFVKVERAHDSQNCNYPCDEFERMQDLCEFQEEDHEDDSDFDFSGMF